MGRVYLAHDPRIDRHVAIKTIHALNVLPDAEADEIRRRFTREAQAAGKLQHPGIVTIFDVGEHEGTYFIAMEYIEGDTLEPHTKKENLLPTGTALSLVVQACEALDYAHQMSIIH
ncbi:MAG TPA: protein kinase, partial [Candidatus Polarisedimenticolia bacterium]